MMMASENTQPITLSMTLKRASALSVILLSLAQTVRSPYWLPIVSFQAINKVSPKPSLFLGKTTNVFALIVASMSYPQDHSVSLVPPVANP